MADGHAYNYTIMRIAFRTDATLQIGTGHFMRCLTLAEALQKYSTQIRFVCRDLPSYLRNLLSDKGIEFAPLDNVSFRFDEDDLAHSKWLGTTQTEDANATIQAISDFHWDYIVVDHYALDVRWERELRVWAKRILVIDDIADRQHDCDILVDQNFYADMHTRYLGKVPAYCIQLLGPRYALLRDEFRKQRLQIKPRTGKVKKILVFFGGADANNHTGLVIEALIAINDKTIQVDVVIGAMHPYLELIQQTCVDHQYTCHVQTSRMAELISEADLAICAGGSAIWERCCLGLPTMSLCIAENQRQQITDAAIEGLLYTPSNSDNLLEKIQYHIMLLLEIPPLLRLISIAGMNAVDGKGVLRISNAMLVNNILIRQANTQDSHNLFKWRNNSSIRAVSNSKALISWKDHKRWFATVLADQNRELLIGSISNKPIGVVRFDKVGDIAEVSIYLVPDSNISGQGRNLLFRAEQWLIANRPDIKSIRAIVLGDNEASKNLFVEMKYCTQKIHYQKDI